MNRTGRHRKPITSQLHRLHPVRVLHTTRVVAREPETGHASPESQDRHHFLLDNAVRAEYDPGAQCRKSGKSHRPGKSGQSHTP